MCVCVCGAKVTRAQVGDDRNTRRDNVGCHAQVRLKLERNVVLAVFILLLIVGHLGESNEVCTSSGGSAQNLC